MGSERVAHIAPYKHTVWLQKSTAEVLKRAALVKNIQNNDEVVIVSRNQPVDQVAPHKAASPGYKDTPLPVSPRGGVRVLLVVRDLFAGAEASATPERQDARGLLDPRSLHHTQHRCGCGCGNCDWARPIEQRYEDGKYAHASKARWSPHHE